MKLLTQEIRRKLPALYATENMAAADAVAVLKLFCPWSSWTWYATEGAQEGDDFIFFGLVEGHVKELGYFSLRELEEVRGPLGLRIERDLHWQPKTLAQIAPELFTDEQPDP